MDKQGRFVLISAKPYFALLRTGLVAGVLATALAACGSSNWGFPYRPNVQQGNWITSEQVAQLQPGLSREQVRYILGTPTLQDIFRTDRWDYPFYNNPGYGKEEQRRFTVWFEGDSLVRWAGDEQPDRQPFEKADTGMTPREGAPAAKEHTTTAQPAADSSPDTQTLPIDSGKQYTPSGITGQDLGTSGMPSLSGQPADAKARTDDSAAGSDQAGQTEEQAQQPKRRLNIFENKQPPTPGAPSAGRGNTPEPLR